MAILQLGVSGLLIGGVYALMSIGLTLIFGVMRVVNFAHGEYLMLAMYATVGLSAVGLDPYVALVVVVPAAYVVGLLSERLIIRRTLDAPHVVQVFVTMGLSILLQNGALLLWSADFRSVHVEYESATVAIGSVLVSWPRLFAFLTAMLTATLLGAFLKFTFLGKAIRATAQDRRAARLMGVDVERIYSVTFALGTALVGVAGVMLTPLYPVNPGTGTDMILVAFVIVVMGGMGSVGGAILSGLLIGLIETFSAYYFGSDMKQIVYFVVFIGLLAFWPAGMFGKRGAEVLEVT